MDLGENHSLRFLCWAPDRALNPQYDGIPDVEKYGAVVSHLRPDGSVCESAIIFESETAQRLQEKHPMWKVESWEPLTLSPSLLCRACGDHGFIRGGKWVKA